MFTPIGFFAGTAVLPPLVDDATLFYSANQNTDWTDLTTNGNNGTEVTVGSGGGSSITHNAGAQPYWQFTTTDPLTERPHVDTGYGLSGGQPWTAMVVVSFDDLTNNWQGFAGYADPTGNPLFTISQNTTGKWFAADRGTSSGNNLFTYDDVEGVLSTDTWYMMMVVADSSGIHLYTNIIPGSEDTSNAATYANAENITIGRDGTLIANYKNQGKIGAYAIFEKALNVSERTELYEYYKDIYSLPFRGASDIYGADAAYSLRRVGVSATNAIQVTRTSDSATQDIGFDADGNLDESALTTFAGANTCVVNKWYDQSGNGDHMTQTTQANMPTIVSSGTIIKQGGKPAVRFDGSNDALTATNNNPFSLTGGASLVATVYKDSGAYNTYETILSAGATGNSSDNNRDMKFFGFPNASSVSPKPAIGTDIWSPSGVQVDASVSTDTRMLIGWYISNWSTHRSTGLSNITKDGSDQTTKAYGTNNPVAHNTNPMKMGVGDEILTPSFFAGDIQEILVFGSDKNTDRDAIQTKVNDYWGVY